MSAPGFIPGMAALVLAVIAQALHADSLTVEVTNVRSAQGRVAVSLCGDRAAQFPGGCITHSAMTGAQAGTVTVRIEDIAPGVYAVQAFHDENANFVPDIPPEGFAFGNGAQWPPGFEAASVSVQGEARTQLRLIYMGGSASASPIIQSGVEPPAGVTRIDLREQGLYGALYVPEGRSPAPALLLVGGSEGGLDTISRMATSFARAGFATLALAYWGAPGLPASLEQVPLEYFDRAIDWLRSQPQVRADGVGMLGWSRGSEAALLAAIHNRSVRAVVAVAPSSIVWQGLNFSSAGPPGPAWTRGGRPLPSLVPLASAYRPDRPLLDLFTASFPSLDAHPEVALPVERIRGGVLLISGGEDQVWPATRFADRIGARLQAQGFRGAYRHLHYPQAGHVVFVGDPDDPAARGLGAPNPVMGGTPAGNEAAWRDNWPKTVEFLRTSLGEAAR